jgi:glycine betaine/proline transport system substrate-binding protein
MDYEVDILSVSAAAMWMGTASGDVDGFTGAWLPVTQGEYWEKLKDKVDFLGKNLVGARIGLAVPAYVEINSIDQLAAEAEIFDSEIVGIDPGAGIMHKTEKAVEAYGLEMFDTIGSSGAMMTATLQNRIKNRKPVVVTAWSPHWMFSRWDMKYLEDPKNIYGDAEYIGTVVRKGLRDDMLWSRDRDPAEAARKWVDANPAKVEAWKK